MFTNGRSRRLHSITSSNARKPKVLRPAVDVADTARSRRFRF
jgi:hypothetical protein